jgi:hypothetical protein
VKLSTVSWCHSATRGRRGSAGSKGCWIRRQRDVVEFKISTAKDDGGLGPSVEDELEHA